MKREEYLSIIEAILFVSPRAVKLAELREALGIDAETTRELVFELEEKLRETGISVSFSGKGYSLVPNPRLRKYYEQFVRKKRQRFSREALEVIAILFKEPRSKDEINKLRGVNSTRMLNTLMKKNYVRKELKEGKVVYTLSDYLTRTISPEIQRLLEDESLFKQT